MHMAVSTGGAGICVRVTGLELHEGLALGGDSVSMSVGTAHIPMCVHVPGIHLCESISDGGVSLCVSKGVCVCAHMAGCEVAALSNHAIRERPLPPWAGPACVDTTQSRHPGPRLSAPPPLSFSALSSEGVIAAVNRPPNSLITTEVPAWLPAAELMAGRWQVAGSALWNRQHLERQAPSLLGDPG